MPFSQDRLDDELAVLCVARKIDFRLVSILLAMKHRNPEVLLLCKEKFDTEKLFPHGKDLVCTSTACQVSYSVVQTYKAFDSFSAMVICRNLCTAVSYVGTRIRYIKVSDHFLRYSL